MKLGIPVYHGVDLLDVAGPLEMFYWTGAPKKHGGQDVDAANRRFVVSANRLTGGGISSGLDEALQLIVLLFGEETAKGVQSTAQYFPQLPVMGQLPWKAPPPYGVKWN